MSSAARRAKPRDTSNSRASAARGIASLTHSRDDPVLGDPGPSVRRRL